MRRLVIEAADARFRQLREAHQQVALAPRIVGAPSRAARLAPYARVEHVAGGEVPIRPLRGRQLRRVSLLAAESSEEPEHAATVLRIAGGRCQREQQQNDQRDADSSMTRSRAPDTGVYH